VTSAEPLFPIVDPARAEKGRRWMRALQRQIADVWQATIETDTHLTRKHGLEAEAETVAISVAFAAIAIRVLDREVFNREYIRMGRGKKPTYLSSKYERFRDSDDQGLVLSGLALIRDSEIHLPVVIDPDLDRAVSIPGTTPTRFRVFPRWRAYRVLPRAVRESRTRGDARRQARAYRSHLAARLVTETLLDALAFMLRCDPSLARRTSDGELEHFPLAELIQHDPYERRHPEWPTVETVAEETRAKVAEQMPAGLEREILHRLVDQDGRVEAYVGNTIVSPAYREAFTERPDQIAADVQGGFRYRVGEMAVRQGSDGLLLVEGDPLDDVPLSAFPAAGGDSRTEVFWRGLFGLTREDGFYYARQRSAG
jgi:hypothetical protein